MQTPIGRLKWNVLPFGLSVSSEIFQKSLTEALADVPGIIVVADDITIYGKSHEDHDAHLETFLKRCQDIGIKLNKKNLEANCPSVSFLGHIVTKDGLKIDPSKVQAISEMAPPTNVEELPRLLGMVNFVAKFILNCSQLLSPLFNLTEKTFPGTGQKPSKNRSMM